MSCDGQTITFNFNKPWPDFNQAAAGMMMTDPYKESFDEGDKSKWKVLSNGPYKVEDGVWDKNKWRDPDSQRGVRPGHRQPGRAASGAAGHDRLPGRPVRHRW